MPYPPENIRSGVLFGALLKSALFAVQLTQATHYFRQSRKDSQVLKVAIGLTMAIDFALLLGMTVFLNLVLVKHYGDEKYVLAQTWLFPMATGTTSACALITQVFLTYRYWTMSRNMQVTSALGCLILAVIVGASGNTIVQSLHPNAPSRLSDILSALGWFGSAITDVAITAALIWQLFTYRPTFQPTKSFIQRLVVMILQTGSASSLIAILVAMGFHIHGLSIVSMSLEFLLGSVYVITVLYVLNTRNEQRRESSAWNTVLFTGDSVRNGVGVHVHRTVYVDDGKTSTPQSEPSAHQLSGRKADSCDFPTAV